MAKVRTWVGLDVHARVTHAGVLDAHTGELRRVRCAGPPEQVLERLVGLPRPVVAVYEAGPTGYGLARLGAERGLELRVCAPGLVARRPAERVKTDARDAERLARLLAAGDLSFVRVPSEQEEQLRDLVRARVDVREDLMRARHRLGKFLLRRGVRYPGQGAAWTSAHHRWLEGLRFGDVASQTALLDYLSAVQALLQRRQLLDAALAEQACREPWAQPVGRLRAFRGIDTLSAVGLVAELGDLARFARPTQVGDFAGLVPSEHTSAEQRRQGRITKAGPRHSRRLLVEAAWHYRHQPRVGESLQRRQRGVDPRVCQVAWRAQRRLHRRWLALDDERGKPRGVVAVACARELCCFLWEAATLT